jgi:hypothetical protein
MNEKMKIFPSAQTETGCDSDDKNIFICQLKKLEARISQLEKDGRRDTSSRKFLTEKDLARRQNMSVKFLQKQRQVGDGVPYHKIGNRVLYRLRDIVAYERENFRKNTSQS